MMTVVCAVLFALWLAATIANQLGGRWRRPLERLNAFGVLPSFGFFAPEPVSVDYHLAFRDSRADGRAGTWREVPEPSRPLLAALWNPGRRRGNAMRRVVQFLDVLSSTAGLDEPTLVLSFPFLYLLHLASLAGHEASTVGRQLMVVQTRGFAEPREVALTLASEIHAV
jgi:hypothetical protein